MKVHGDSNVQGVSGEKPATGESLNQGGKGKPPKQAGKNVLDKNKENETITSSEQEKLLMIHQLWLWKLDQRRYRYHGIPSSVAHRHWGLAH